ncbi:MAG: hypothetical protein ACJ8LN_11610 [Sulfurifustis sp.]
MLAATATSLTAWCAPVPAAQWEVRPSIDVGAISDDNIQLTTSPRETTSGYVGALRVDGRRTTETSKATFNGYVTHTTYTTGDIPDKTEQGLTLNAEQATSERGKIGLDGEYRHDALFETTIVRRGTGDVRDVDVALTSNVQARRNYWVLAPSWNWLLTERSGLRFGYRFTDASFSNDVGTDLVDYTENLLSATYTHQLNPRDDLNLTANAVRYRPATGANDADTVQLLVGVSRAFSETLRGQVAFGGTRTTTQTASGEDTGSGVAANASIRQNAETSTFEGIISRDITPSGVGQAVRTDQFRIWWSRRLSESVEFVFETQLIRTHGLEGGTTGVNRRYFDVAPELRWQWLEDLYLVGSVRHRRQKLEADVDTATSNAVFLGLSYRL